MSLESPPLSLNRWLYVLNLHNGVKYTTAQKFGIIRISLLKKVSYANLTAFIWSKYSKNSNNVKYYFIKNCFLFEYV